MSEYRKAKDDTLYFVTLTVVGWVDLFTRAIYKDVIITNIKHCQENERLQVYAYVIMSNHLHMLCRRREGELSELLGRFKGYTSKQLLKAIEQNGSESRREWLLREFETAADANKQYGKYHLWQYTSHPIPIESWDVAIQKQQYIHRNPVRAGIVNEASAYIYSSACADSPLRTLEL
jgi:putative transposase